MRKHETALFRVALVRVEAEYDFAELEPVAILQRALALYIGELVVVHDERVRPGEIPHDPLPVDIRKMGVTPADRCGGESNVLCGRPAVTTEIELDRLARDADESDFLMARIARDDFQACRQELDGLLARADESYGLRRNGLSLVDVIDDDRPAMPILVVRPIGGNDALHWRPWRERRRGTGGCRRSCGWHKRRNGPFSPMPISRPERITGAAVHREEERWQRRRGTPDLADPAYNYNRGDTDDGRRDQE